MVKNNNLLKLDKTKYFDYPSTYPLNKRLTQWLYLTYEDKGIFGNPSSINNSGINAKVILNDARSIIADTLSCKPEEIIFTSSGSESDNMAIKGVMLKYKPGEAEMITTTVEHSAVLETCKQLERFGYTIHYIKPDENGLIRADDIKTLINDKTKLISMMYVNNETGTIQNIKLFATIAHKHNVLFHTDAVQSIGKVPLVPIQNYDLVSFSGHKFGGMTGTGFLYKKEGIELEPLICGGGQEFGYRAGTENVFGNTLMALCFNQTYYYSKNNNDNFNKIREKKENKLWNLEIDFVDNLTKILGEENIRLNGMGAGVVNISFAGIDSNVLQLRLNNEGFEVSTASACHSNKDNPEPSYVLQELNVPDKFLNGTLRIGFSFDTKRQSVKKLEKAIIKNVNELMGKSEE